MNSSTKHRRPSLSLLVAILALVVAMGGVSYAAVKLPKDSVGAKQIKSNGVLSDEIKDKSIKAADLAPGVVPAGATAYTKSFPTISVTNAGNSVGSLSLPAGSYFVTARANSANQGSGPTRLECSLASGATQLDFSKYGLGGNPSDGVLIYEALSMAGVITLPAAGTVGLGCGSTNGASNIEMITARLTAVKVGSVVTLP